VLNRDDRDFSDADLDTARRPQDHLALVDIAVQCLTAHRSPPSARCSTALPPSLAALAQLDACNQAKAAEDRSIPSGPESAEEHGLTDREVQVLSLLADGLTAGAIGRVLGISPRTVSKQLEHAYTKLGSRDRLLAVRRAAALGLLKH